MMGEERGETMDGDEGRGLKASQKIKMIKNEEFKMKIKIG
jgi:hypothetical protein